MASWGGTSAVCADSEGFEESEHSFVSGYVSCTAPGADI